jgi:hypothetical protein
VRLKEPALTVVDPLGFFGKRSPENGALVGTIIHRTKLI